MTGKTRSLSIAFLVLGALSVAVLIIIARLPPNPVFRGKRISVWHRELCYGVYGGRSKHDDELFVESYNAFGLMGTNAVPYLAAELRYLRSQRVEEVFRCAQRQPIIRPLLRSAVGPTERRCYAAVALRQIGPRAADAIPALLETWKNDCPEVRLNCIYALASIMYGAAPAGMPLAEGKAFKERVIIDAAKRYPVLARDLMIPVEISEATNTPNVGKTSSVNQTGSPETQPR